jgi:hypothetical protein
VVVLTDIPDEVRERGVPCGRHVRLLAPLATAIGVIIAATIGLVLAQVEMPGHPHLPAISSTTMPTTR